MCVAGCVIDTVSLSQALHCKCKVNKLHRWDSSAIFIMLYKCKIPAPLIDVFKYTKTLNNPPWVNQVRNSEVLSARDVLCGGCCVGVGAGQAAPAIMKYKPAWSLFPVSVNDWP